MRHGTISGHRQHVTDHEPSCAPCLKAKAEYARKARRLKAYGRWDHWTDPTAARSHVTALQAQGMKLPDIAQTAGISKARVERLVHGDHGNPLVRIKTSMSTALLAVEFAPRTVDAIGVTRRIQALSVMGWSFAVIGRRLGVSPQGVGMFMREPRLLPETVGRVSAVYDEMWSRPGGNAEVARRARAKGWVGPLAWDDDTIDDPAAEPYTETADRRIEPEDVEFVLSHDPVTTARQLAERFGCSVDGIQQACRRAGRADLLAKLARNAELAA